MRMIEQEKQREILQETYKNEHELQQTPFFEQESIPYE